MSVPGIITTYLNQNNILSFQQTINQGSCFWISWGKINDDALEDLAGGGLTQSYAYVFINLGNGLLNSDPALVDVGGPVRKLELANLYENYEANLYDLIVGVNGLVKIFSNDQASSFDPDARQVIDFGSAYPYHFVDDFVLGDVDRDYFNDLIVCNTTGRRIRTYLNRGDGAFDDVNYMEVDEFFYTHQIALGEIDYDGYPDLALASADYLKILYNEGDDNFDVQDPEIMLPMPGLDMETEELIFADLVGHGAMSILGTGVATYPPQYGFYVFMDLGDPAPCPPGNFQVVEFNGHPKLSWAPNMEDDIMGYNLYREITPPYEIPQTDDFEILQYFAHSAGVFEYVDLEVYVRESTINCSAWYFVTALDSHQPEPNESVPSEIVKFLAMYHPQSEKRTSEEIGLTLPEVLGISASPNPFNLMTNMYQLPRAAFVNLAVYDLQDRPIAQLVDAWRGAGVHAVSFDGSRIPSGVYICRFVAGKYSASGKMLLLKQPPNLKIKGRLPGAPLRFMQILPAFL